MVTHHRLEAGPDGGLVPAGELEEPLVVRPTSETIIGATYAKWVQSYRDLPILINQWANVVRWEMRTRLFLRTTEFLWQEGHTAHATEAEAESEARLILDVYRTFMEDWMAMPLLTGVKTESEKFAGAQCTYSCEALMQDNKALQAGTTHHLGQNFAKAFDVQYQTADGGLDYVWSTSWGVSTRMVGGLIMTHSDDTGLVCPPRLAPVQVAIVPIWKTDEQKTLVLEVGARVLAGLREAGVRVELDDREEMKPGAKYYEWESRGVPIRLEIGPRDVENEQAMMARRTGGKDPIKLDSLVQDVQTSLDEIQASLYRTALERRDANSVRNVSKDQLIELMDGDGGFAYGGFCGAESCEMAIKDRTKAAVRVLPDQEFRSDPSPAKCVWCGADSKVEAVWAKAY